MQSDQERMALYGGYSAWKTWNGTARDRAGNAWFDEFYTIECRRAGLPPKADVLEIGFGNGEFLNWCKNAGHRIKGVEIIPEFVERARAAGYDAVLCSGAPPELPPDATFDLIAAFDIFEHLTVAQLHDWLTWIAAHLRPGGRVLAKFPNGGSPLGRYHQNGDLTHCSALSASSIAQAAGLAGLRLVAAHNAARPIGHSRAKLARTLTYLMRDAIEVAVGHIYFGRRLPLDPTMTVILALDGPAAR